MNLSAAVWRIAKRFKKAKKGPERHKARHPFSFRDQITLLPQTSLEQKIFDKMWNLQLGWNWMESAQGKLFFDNEGHNIKERELSKTHLDGFGCTGPWRDFWGEDMAIYYSMKEPVG